MDQGLALTPMQRRLLDANRRHGPRGIVVGVTAASVALSLSVTGVAMAATRAPADIVAWALPTSVAIPLVVAPMASLLAARLVSALGQAHDRLHQLVTVDTLTGATTRGAFFDRAAVLVAVPRQSSDALLVGMVDADRFKELNDSCGHAAGDRALVDLVAALREWCGGDAIVGRLGGDEFAFVRLVHRDDVARELRALHDRCAEVGRVGDRAFSASAGVVALGPGESLDDALGRADAELYRRKTARGAHRHITAITA